ncbi:hypothetical protein [uncultured Erythrobacter sp.]|uniref:hypothetical protein n=1 Tax=uncultured Erythrobacter sp. TaxID=263913 RepID=UPI00262476F2|nr:hypothetical protein [uncultured Erythrobacter sp.]
MTSPSQGQSSDRDASAPDHQGGASNAKPSKGKLPPAPTAGTAVNLAIAEIVLRGVADRMRGKVQADISKAVIEKRKADQADAVDGRSLLTSVGLYGAARLAKRSRAGLGLVAGGLLAKSLYDRGKAVRERRKRRR